MEIPENGRKRYVKKSQCKNRTIKNIGSQKWSEVNKSVDYDDRKHVDNSGTLAITGAEER